MLALLIHTLRPVCVCVLLIVACRNDRYTDVRHLKSKIFRIIIIEAYVKAKTSGYISK